MAISSSQQEVLKVVIGLFNVAPGKANFDALSSLLEGDNAMTPLQIAEALDDIPLFVDSIMGSATTTAAQVNVLMSHFGLSTAGDLNPNSAASVAHTYFTDRIENGDSFGSIVYDAVVFLSGSVATEFAATAALLSNKAAVAEYWSVTKGLSAATLEELGNVISKVTATSDVSSDAAIEALIAQATDSVSPVATPATFSFAENVADATTALGTVTATDNSTVTGFEIVSGNDSGFFAIDSTGKITLTDAGTKSAANDFETAPNSFTLGVNAIDAAGNKSSTVDIVLNVTDVDDVAPAFVGATAAAGSNKVTVNFGEALKAGNPAATAFTVKDGSTTVGVTAAAVNGSAVTLTLASNIAGTVTVGYDSANAGNKLQDAAGNIVANFDNKTVSSDAIAPTLSSSTPIDGGTLGKADNVVLTFSEDVTLGSGNITIVNSSDSKDTRTIAVNDSSQVTVSGTKVTINPTADLVESGTYYINIPNTAVLDKAGNAYAGISDLTTLNFSTTAASSAGTAFTLTTNIDTFAGGAGDDTFSAAAGTFGALDSLNGGGGTDTLNVALGAAYGGGATVTGVEKVNISMSAGGGFNASGISGATDITSNASAVDPNITGIASLVNPGVLNHTAPVNVTFAYSDSVVAGGSDAVKLTLNNAMTAASQTININNTTATTGATGIETLTVDVAGTVGSNTAGTSVTTATLATNATQSLTKLVFTGSGAADIVLGANVTTTALTIDAGAMTGNLTLGGLGAVNHNVKLGSGNDTVLFGGNYNTTDVVDGGAGTNDAISSTAANFVAVTSKATNVSNIETIRATDDAGATGTIDLSFFGASNFRGSAQTGGQVLTVNNIATGGKATIDAAALVGAATDLVLNVKDAALPGTSDTLNIDVTSTGVATAAATVAGVETFNVNTTNTAGGALTLALTAAAGTALNVTNAGGQNFITTLGATFSTVNLANVTGAGTTSVTMTAGGVGVSYTGSGNNDTFVGTNSLDVINAGAGNDTITGLNGADRINVGTGTDSVVYTAAGETTSLATAATLVSGTTVISSTVDVLTGLGTGDTINVSGVIATITGAAASTITGATGTTYSVTRGNYDSSSGVWTTSATGADSIFAYDVDGAGAATVTEFAVLVGYTGSGGTAAAGVITLA